MVSFKSQHTFEQRKDESGRIRAKYQDRVPVICEKQENTVSKIGEIDKKKYLVPIDLTIGQFIYVIRKRLKLPADEAIFIMVKGFIPQVSTQLAVLYRDYKDEDGFLYVTYNGENVFG